jgi:hypothetical protein
VGETRFFIFFALEKQKSDELARYGRTREVINCTDGYPKCKLPRCVLVHSSRLSHYCTSEKFFFKHRKTIKNIALANLVCHY